MAPTLRSSLGGSGTPSNPSTPTTTPTTTPRKTPHCTKCKRPKAGHPRQGCPYTDSPFAHTEDSDTSVDGELEQEEEKITNALGSMNIEFPVPENAGMRSHPPGRRSPVKPVIPEPSLASLSTNSSEIVARLLIPGLMDENTDEEERLGKWQESVLPHMLVKRKGSGSGKMAVRSPMPGTLNTPSSSFFQSTQGELSVKDDIEHPPPSPTTTTATVRAPRPLARSSSAEARELFLLRLDTTSTAPPATMYVLPKADIPALQHAAMRLGFHSRIVDPVLDPKDARTPKVKDRNQNESNDGRLILGRDEKAVHELYEGVKLGRVIDDAEKNSEKGPGKLSVAAGGVIVGAVATFTGLAYS